MTLTNDQMIWWALVAIFALWVADPRIHSHDAAGEPHYDIGCGRTVAILLGTGCVVIILAALASRVQPFGGFGV